MLYVFDMGNVVIKGIDVLGKTVELLGVDTGEFLADYRHYSFPLMDGTLTCEDYYRHVEHVFNVEIKSKPFSDFFEPYFNQPMVEAIDFLHSCNSRVVCASNTFEPHWTVIRNLGLDRVFDKCYLSHEMGLTKPSAAFFKSVLEQENISASDVIFTDDYRENIEAAEKLGMKTLWYHKDFNDSELLPFFKKTLLINHY